MHSNKNLPACIACIILFLTQVQLRCLKGHQIFPLDPNSEMEFKFLFMGSQNPSIQISESISKLYNF
jgi:hypothetical protein